MKKLYIDIGGTHLRSELQGPKGSVFQTLSSVEKGLFAYICETIREDREIGFVGIAYAGQVYEGEILSAPNIKIDEARIKHRVEAEYGVRLEIDNDLNCAVMAEAEHYGAQSIAALYVGTGLGAALIDGGRLVRGGKNLAFEIGHIPYRNAPFSCGCGRDNCIELFASGSGIGKWLRYLCHDRTSDLAALKASEAQEERAIAEQFEEALLHAAGTVVSVANPLLLVLGGGIVRENPFLFTLLKNRLGDFALKASLELLRIETSVLENAPIQGAKLLEKRKYG
jgi:glucokinase